MPQEDTSTLSIVDSSGRQVSILNHHQESASFVQQRQQEDTVMDETTVAMKRKYICNEPGCFKSFTTSGHLARHHRIHTGEKNFPCLFPGCPSRFSRQDNMMQHYRTHLSPKSRRTKKQPDDRSQPRLHAHHRIQSDTTAPLTIDQHLRNYHQSRLYHRPHTSHAYTSNNAKDHHHHLHHIGSPLPSMVTNTLDSPPNHVTTTTPLLSIPSASSSPSLSSTLGTATATMSSSSSSSSTLSPSSASMPAMASGSPSSITNFHRNTRHRSTESLSSASSLVPYRPIHRHISSSHSSDIFYQHRPLIYTECQDTNPTTLLNPTPINKVNESSSSATSSLSASSSSSSASTYSSSNSTNMMSSTSAAQRDDGTSSNSLIQLANIVSSFG